MKDLEKLISLPTVSGSEDKYTNEIKEIFDGCCDKTTSDILGNVYAFKKSENSRKSIIIDAHLDIIGLMVNKINDDGLICFSKMGGVDSRILPSMKVVIHGKKDIKGVIGVPPPHLLSDGENEPYPIESLTIDTGLKKEELIDIVNIGDFISFSSELTYLLNNRISANGLDNKLGVYSVLQVLKNEKFSDADITAALTVGEEINLNGARTASSYDNYDLCIVIDVTHGHTPDSKEDICFELGSGPSIALGPGLSKYYSDLLIKCAEKNNIPYTIEVTNGYTGTNSLAYEVSGNGIPCVIVSIPLRYMHTAYETADMNDVYELIKLISLYIKDVEEESADA